MDEQKNIDETTFDALLEPIAQEIDAQIEKHQADEGSATLFCADFIRIMIYAMIMRIKSLRLIATELKSSEVANKLGLPKIPFSTLRDGFDRFPVILFQTLFAFLVTQVSFMQIPEIQELGMIWLIDGSLFPALINMEWANYKKNKNAIRLHMAFELNRMLTVEFAVDEGNSSERKFLVSVLQSGITYVADRGYFAFWVFKDIVDAQAFFIIRAKENLKYTIQTTLPITGVPKIFKNVSDSLVILNNDPHQLVYRLIKFSIGDSQFLLVTNRLDLTTFQVILLYAYRWQVELLFRFLKQTLNGLHLLKHSQEGIQIQFYLLLITAMLELKLKQRCVQDVENPKQADNSEESISQLEPDTSSQAIQRTSDCSTSPYHFLKTIGKKLHKYWKIGVHWLKILQNRIACPFDKNTIELLGET
jgi:hypothetical protein